MIEFTTDPRKLALYEQDVYFLEGLSDWADVDALSDLALMVIKPEAVVRRAIERIIDATREIGFELQAVTTHMFSRHSLRELWRYQLNQASSDRLTVVDAILQYCPSAVVLLRSADRPTDEPASRLLSKSKGHSDPQRRRADHLRSRVEAGPSVLNFIHVADEPADVVRELAVLGNRRQRLDLHGQTARVAQHRISQIAHDLYSTTLEHDLRLDSSLERLGLTPDGNAVEHCLRALEARADVNHLWDQITVIVHGMKQSRDNVAPVLASVTDLNA